MTDSANILILDCLCKSFGRKLAPAVNQVNLTLDHGEILALLGPSGCGKTTLLRLIAGFDTPQSGDIRIKGRSVIGVPPEKRDVGMVFQDFALFPHLTARQNVAFGLKQESSQNKQKITSQTLNLVGLQDLGQRYPHELSGGQQQRLALARAIAPNPALILLDEPLSNLDVQIRWQLRSELRRILKTAGKSAIIVTHDQEEALHIADRVAVMRAGCIEQVGTPEEIYQQPQSRFVAEFVTQANFVPAQLQDNQWHSEIGTFPAPDRNLEAVELLIPQEALSLEPDPNGVAEVSDHIFLGREVMYYLHTRSGQQIIARTGNHSQKLPIGTRVNLRVSHAKPCPSPLTPTDNGYNL